MIKDGQVVYQGAYGMANIEHGAANGRSTVFMVASVAKQFTAFAIHLLVQDGKLALDDDIRKYLPELHDAGRTITLRHLIHHTSGLRDQLMLLGMAGWRSGDVVTEADLLRLVRQQKALNFKPGREFMYSNTGYSLLGMIVERVSGKPLAAFAEERIFRPLGMHQTRFHEDYRTLVKGRASSYEKTPRGTWRYVASSNSYVGSTGLLTTIDDLARWDRNFYDGKVGGRAVIDGMLARGKLANGHEIDYAGGLMLGQYRDVEFVEHSGGDAGFRANIVRFPAKRVSVVILSNAANLNPVVLSRKVADRFLELPLPDAQADPVEVKLDAAGLDRFVGDFAVRPSFVISITKDDAQLTMQATGQPKFPLWPSGTSSFFLKEYDLRLVFDPPDANGIIAGATLHQGGEQQLARRITPPALSRDELEARTGSFFSDELNVIYTIALKDDALVLRHARGEMTLTQWTATRFNSGFGELDYHCAAARHCNSFSISNGRLRQLVFNKVAITPVEPATPPLSPFASAPVYLRGSMNDWTTSLPLRPDGKQLATRIFLAPGLHEFKIASDDFLAIDFGSVPGSAAMQLGEARTMEALGANVQLDVRTAGSYRFALDVSDPESPRLTVSQ